MTPEQKARLTIDKNLISSGFTLQSMSEFNPTASLGVVVREFQTNSGPVDYLIFIDKKPVGVIEAKATDKGQNLTTVAEQSKRYAESGLKFMKTMPAIRFAYEATDVMINFIDYFDEKARSRQVFSFHKPETLKKILDDESTLRNRMKGFPKFNTDGFRQCQIKAIVDLEKSFSENRPRALIQMATAAGKTFTAITAVYRLLKHAKAKRILFLVDTKNLGEQAEQEFRSYTPNDDTRTFPELYNVIRLNSSYIPEDNHVCISTIQRMYSILRGEELDESLEQSPATGQVTKGRSKDVVYNSRYPVGFFDAIIIDECHRSIYNVWQQVLDYFDSFLIGLTATPDKRTFAFFNENVVSEYPHEQAVIDGVNVFGEPFIIDTDITQKGGTILKQLIQKRNRLSRQKRWEQLDEDINYPSSRLDSDIVNPSQIRTVIKTFRQALFNDMFIGRKEVPKTLVFAKNDSHADDVIKIIREEFGEGNEFCKKVTYKSKEDPKSTLASFRNDFYPRIAVTVDMIATGTDVKPLECLIFMRDVKSKNYFEQMKGRGTRTLDYDNLRKVTPSATTNKQCYILIDAVGVTKSNKTDSRPLERKPFTSLKNLMLQIAMGDRDDDTLTSVAGRLIKLDKILTPKEKDEVASIAGLPLNKIAENMLNAFDEDVIDETAKCEFGDIELEKDQIEQVQQQLAEKACEPIYDAKLREYILDVKKTHEQVIDDVNLDKVIFAGWGVDREKRAEQTIQNFRKFIEDNKDEITALNIIYNKSYKERPLTLEMIKQLYDIIQKPPYNLSTEKLWEAYRIKQNDKVKEKSIINKFTEIVSLIRFELGQSKELNLFSAQVNLKFRKWIFDENAGHGQFNDRQMEWLRLIRDHIAISMQITEEDLEFTPFDTKGGLGKFYELFGDDYQQLLHDISIALVA